MDCCTYVLGCPSSRENALSSLVMPSRANFLELLFVDKVLLGIAAAEVQQRRTDLLALLSLDRRPLLQQPAKGC